MSDKRNVLSTDDLPPRPRAVNEAAANQITGGAVAAPPSKLDPFAAKLEGRGQLPETPAAPTKPAKKP